MNRLIIGRKIEDLVSKVRLEMCISSKVVVWEI